MQQSGKGFTLIELLVVIAIIGLLSSVVLAALNTAKMKANDSKRTQQMEQLTRALELYALNNDGALPLTAAADQDGTCNSPTCVTALTSYLVPTYLSTMPIDSKYGNTTNGFRYTRCSTPDTYAILMRHETGGDGGSPDVAGWCNFRTTSEGTYVAPGNTAVKTCWLNSDNTPVYRWCSDEI